MTPTSKLIGELEQLAASESMIAPDVLRIAIARIRYLEAVRVRLVEPASAPAADEARRLLAELIERIEDVDAVEYVSMADDSTREYRYSAALRAARAFLASPVHPAAQLTGERAAGQRPKQTMPVAEMCSYCGMPKNSAACQQRHP